MIDALKSGGKTSEFFLNLVYLGLIAANGLGWTNIPWDFMWAGLGVTGPYTAKRGALKIAAILKKDPARSVTEVVRAFIHEAKAPRDQRGDEGGR